MLHRTKRFKLPQKTEQYDEDDPEAYKAMPVPDKVSSLHYNACITLPHSTVAYLAAVINVVVTLNQIGIKPLLFFSPEIIQVHKRQD